MKNENTSSRNFHYYNPIQKGSASIKNVLPALTDISYKDLEINNGIYASIMYQIVTHTDVSEEERQKVRENLEKYCELDTWAEVKIIEALRQLLE
jgi:elongation factor P hydroxylase